MIKLKYTVLIFFVLAMLQVYAVPSNELRASFSEDVKIELSFEANDSYPNIFGDVPAGCVVFNTFITETNCDPGFNKSKVVSSGLFFSVTKCNLKFVVAQSSFFTRYSAVYIPIYIQTASFLL